MSQKAMYIGDKMSQNVLKLYTSDTMSQNLLVTQIILCFRCQALNADKSTFKKIRCLYFTCRVKIALQNYIKQF